MKTKNLIIAVIAIAFTAIFFPSCEKEIDTPLMSNKDSIWVNPYDSTNFPGGITDSTLFIDLTDSATWIYSGDTIGWGDSTIWGDSTNFGG